MIGDSESIIITIVNVVVIRDQKSRLAPTHVGAFLLSFHSILFHHLDQELSFLLTHSKSIQQKNSKQVLSFSRSTVRTLGSTKVQPKVRPDENKVRQKLHLGET